MPYKSLLNASVSLSLTLGAVLAVNPEAEAGTITYEEAARIAADYVELPATPSRAAGTISDAERPYYIFNDRHLSLIHI